MNEIYRAPQGPQTSRASYPIQNSYIPNNSPYLHELSTDKYLLDTKHTNTRIEGRAFSAAAPETCSSYVLKIDWLTWEIKS